MLKINNIDEAKEQYLYSTLDKQIKDGKYNVEMNKNDYDFLCSRMKMFVKGYRFKSYKKHPLIITGEGYQFR